MTGHLSRAINLWQDARTLHRDAMLSAQMGLAILTLDSKLRLIYANPAAEALLRETTRLRLVHGQLSAAFSREHAALQAP